MKSSDVYKRQTRDSLYGCFWYLPVQHGRSDWITDRGLSISHQRNGRKEMIQLENVHKSYGQTKVLKGIDLQIQDQDDVVILGPSGSGKSTLLNVLSGLEKVDEGHILIQGQDLSQLTDAQLTAFRRKKIAFIFQQYYLLPNLTVRQNVKMGADLANNHDSVSYTHLDVYKRQASGDYHHHLAVNEWGGKNLAKREKGMIGLAYYVLEVEDKGDLIAIAERAKNRGAEVKWLSSNALTFKDNDGILTRVRKNINN